MIVDTHVHIWEMPPVAPVGPTAPRWTGEPTAPGTAEMLLEEMDANGVDRTVLVQTSFSTWDNGYVADSAQRFPDRFVAQGLVDPLDPDNAAHAAYWMDERGMTGFRFHPMYYRTEDPNEGEILTIVGESGSGKSTLLNLIGLLDDPDEGRLIFRGGDLYRMRGPTRSRFRSREIGFVFQLYHLLPELDVVANTLLPAMIRYTWLGWQARKRRLRERAESLLERVGMYHRLRHRPSQLSGGERQRVAIARALMNDPAVVLCDEPTGNLDERTSEGIVELILDLNRTLRKTFVIVTHERDVAALGHRRIRIEHGKLVFEATAPI